MSEEPQNRVEARARRRASPAGIRTCRPARVEPEPPPSTKKQELAGTTTRVAAVVYYLCRNHQLEHPHLMEVPLASPQQGLYLRDVVSRLDALRGKGMAAKYSWSCKRRYKSGFVWHDLWEGDLLLPAQGAEYVLKGSELQLHQSTPGNAKVELPRPTPQQEPPPDAAVPVPVAAIQRAVAPSASTTIGGYEEQCRMPRSGSSSPKTSTPSSGSTSPGLDNLTQTETDGKGRGASVKPQVAPAEIADEPQQHRPAGELSPCRTRTRRSGTLQSLIRAEAAGRRSSRLLLLEEEEHEPSATATATEAGSVSCSLRPAANLLARLMACGPNNPGFVQTSYRPRFTRLEYPPPSPELCPLGALKPATEISIGGLLHSAAAKVQKPSSASASSSDSHQDGVSHSLQGDPVNRSRGTRTSGPSSGKAASLSKCGK